MLVERGHGEETGHREEKRGRVKRIGLKSREKLFIKLFI